MTSMVERCTSAARARSSASAAAVSTWECESPFDAYIVFAYLLQSFSQFPNIFQLSVIQSYSTYFKLILILFSISIQYIKSRNSWGN